MTGLERRESGTVLVVALVIVIALVGLSSVFLGRTMYERKRHGVQEDSMEALFNAYGKMARAEAILNRAGYDEETGRNLALKAALEAEKKEIEDTGVRVEAIGNAKTTVFFHLTAEDRVNRVLRRVRILIREKESFADYNYFVNRHPLGIAGKPTPRGSIHSNKSVQFYFPDGRFVDPVTAAEGFEFKAGASAENTTFLGEFNASAERIPDLNNVDIPKLKNGAKYTVSDPDLDVKIILRNDKVQIQQWTKESSIKEQKYKTKKTKVGVEDVEVVKETKIYRTEEYWAKQSIYEKQKQTYWTKENVYETKKVQKTKKVPVYGTRTVTKYKTEKVWVEDKGAGAGGGTSIAGGGGGSLGHWETNKVPYKTTEKYVDHYNYEKYWTTEKVKVGTKNVQKTKTVNVKVGEKDVKKTKKVYDHSEYKTVTEQRSIYEEELVPNGYRTVRQSAEKIKDETIAADGVIYVAGDIITLEGELNGNITVASNGMIYVTGSLVYVDASGDPAYKNGNKPELPYEPNESYDGSSVLGVIADKDILYTKNVPNNFELNGSFLSRTGRIGITGIQLDEAGEVSAAE